MKQSHLQIINMIHKAVNKALGKAQNERRKENIIGVMGI